MNKRQKKKNVTKAIERYQSGKATSKDYTVLRTYGRKELLETYSLPPDLDVGKLLDDFTSTVARIVQGAVEAISRFGKVLGKMQANGELARMAERRIEEKDEETNL